MSHISTVHSTLKHLTEPFTYDFPLKLKNLKKRGFLARFRPYIANLSLLFYFQIKIKNTVGVKTTRDTEIEKHFSESSAYSRKICFHRTRHGLQLRQYYIRAKKNSDYLCSDDRIFWEGSQKNTRFLPFAGGFLTHGKMFLLIFV